MPDLADTFVAAVERVLPLRRPINHHEPVINGIEAKFVTECLIGGMANDDWVKRFEGALGAYCGVDHVVATSSGTAALHLALLTAGVKPNDEVLVPSLTFVATANAVTYCGAIPNFYDGSIGFNAYKLRCYLERQTKPNPDGKGRLNRTTERAITALLTVDLLGFPAEHTRLQQLADEFGLVLIEDAAQALGARLGNRMCGSFGLSATVSFNNNKIITGNGGGALLTNDPWVAAKAWGLATTSKVTHPWRLEHDAVAYNYRMPNLCAALLCAQLGQLDGFLASKQRLHARYQQALAEVPEVEVLTVMHPWQGQPNYWLTTALLGPKAVTERDAVLEGLHAKGIKARALFTPLHLLPMYAGNPRDRNMLYSEDAAKRAICLPSGPAL